MLDVETWPLASKGRAPESDIHALQNQLTDHSMTELSDTDSENEENQLPEGTFAVALSKATQEKFEVVANWHLSELEPQKEIPLEVLQADVELRKQAWILKN